MSNTENATDIKTGLSLGESFAAPKYPDIILLSDGDILGQMSEKHLGIPTRQQSKTDVKADFGKEQASPRLSFWNGHDPNPLKAHVLRLKAGSMPGN